MLAASIRLVSSYVQTGHTLRRIVSILISSALAYTNSEMELNRILFSCLERKSLRGELRHVLDHSFNVCLGVSGGEMELTRTCCFEFDRMLRADSKRVLLSTFCFYFRVALFTSLSLLPQVDKIIEL